MPKKVFFGILSSGLVSSYGRHRLQKERDDYWDFNFVQSPDRRKFTGQISLADDGLANASLVHALRWDKHGNLPVIGVEPLVTEYDRIRNLYH